MILIVVKFWDIISNSLSFPVATENRREALSSKYSYASKS